MTDDYNVLGKEIRRGITSRQQYFNACDCTLETNENAEKAIVDTIKILQISTNEYDRRDNFEKEAKALKIKGQQNMEDVYHRDMPTLEDLTAFE